MTEIRPLLGHQRRPRPSPSSSAEDWDDTVLQLVHDTAGPVVKIPVLQRFPDPWVADPILVQIGILNWCQNTGLPSKWVAELCYDIVPNLDRIWRGQSMPRKSRHLRRTRLDRWRRTLAGSRPRCWTTRPGAHAHRAVCALLPYILCALRAKMPSRTTLFAP